MPPALNNVPPFGYVDPTIVNALGLGGPCPASRAYCTEEAGEELKGTFCGNDHSICGDPAWCDACAVRGGVTTQDEMFILIGSYYIPEPEASLLAVAALGALGVLARRRRGA
jgi:hypothetical protein